MLSKDKDAQISRFWDKYVEKSKRCGIKQDFIRWHVRHAELYIKSHNTPLKSHTSIDVDKYLQAKSRSAKLKDWVRFTCPMHSVENIRMQPKRSVGNMCFLHNTPTSPTSQTQ